MLVNAFTAGRPRPATGRRTPTASGVAVECAAWIGIALLVRLIRIGARPLWIDEAFTARWSRLPIGLIAGAGRHLEPTPPAYYLVLHAWTALAGTGDASLRMPSAICSALTVAVTLMLGRRLGGASAGRAAALLLLLNPCSLFFAQEARAYAILALVEAVLLLAFAVALDARATAGRRAAGFAAAAAAGSTAVALHYTSVPFIAAGWAVVGYQVLRSPVANAGMAGSQQRFGVPALALAVTLFLAVGPVHDALHLARSDNIAWIPPTDWSTLRDFATGVLTDPGFEPRRRAEIASAGLLVLAAAALAVGRPRPLLIWLAVGVPTLDVILLVLLSVNRPILLPRIGVGVTVPFCLVLGGAARARSRVAAALVIVPAALVFVGCDAAYTAHYVKQDWRDAARAVATDPACDDGPVVTWGPFAHDLLRYAPALGRRTLVDVLPPIFDGSAALAAERFYARPAATLRPAALAPFLAAHPHGALVVLDLFRADETAALGPTGSIARNTREWPGGLAVSCR